MFNKYFEYVFLAAFLALIFLFSPRVHAVEFEILVGKSTYTQSNNGIWYQTGSGLDYHFDKETNSIGLGITDYASESVRFHAGYMNLGTTTSWGVATPDVNYTGSGCRTSPCEKYDTYMGRGSVEGFYFTLAPEFRYKDVKFFIEGGLWTFLARFNATVTGIRSSGHTEVFFNTNKEEDWQVAPVVGFGIEYNKTQLVFSAWRVDSSKEWDVMIPNYQGYTTNLSIRHIF